MPKARRSPPRALSVKIPPRRTREKFLMIFELEGCQKAVNFLTEYYRVRRTKIILNGRKVGNGDIAVYFQNKAYFTKRGLTKRTVLHELYHHLMYINRVDMTEAKEEKAANTYAREFLKHVLAELKTSPNN
jgi:hypothetical protein